MLTDYRNVKHELVILNNQISFNPYLYFLIYIYWLPTLETLGKYKRTLARSSMAATLLGSRGMLRSALWGWDPGIKRAHSAFRVECSSSSWFLSSTSLQSIWVRVTIWGERRETKIKMEYVKDMGCNSFLFPS